MAAPPLQPTPWLRDLTRHSTVQMLQSHQRAFGRALIAADQAGQPERLLCQELFHCGFPVLAHGRGEDPLLTYANAAALQLWGASWTELVGLPSRLTAPDSERRERQRALGQAQNHAAVCGYGGIRISRQGHRFMIRNARIWNLWDDQDQVCGQAACFSD